MQYALFHPDCSPLWVCKQAFSDLPKMYVESGELENLTRNIAKIAYFLRSLIYFWVTSKVSFREEKKSKFLILISFDNGHEKNSKILIVVLAFVVYVRTHAGRHGMRKIIKHKNSSESMNSYKRIWVSASVSFLWRELQLCWYDVFTQCAVSRHWRLTCRRQMKFILRCDSSSCIFFSYDSVEARQTA